MSSRFFDIIYIHVYIYIYIHYKIIIKKKIDVPQASRYVKGAWD